MFFLNKKTCAKQIGKTCFLEQKFPQKSYRVVEIIVVPFEQLATLLTPGFRFCRKLYKTLKTLWVATQNIERHRMLRHRRVDHRVMRVRK